MFRVVQGASEAKSVIKHIVPVANSCFDQFSSLIIADKYIRDVLKFSIFLLEYSGHQILRCENCLKYQILVSLTSTHSFWKEFTRLQG